MENLTGIKITALTEKGTKALKDSLEREHKETTFLQRQSFRQGFYRAIDIGPPFTITITIKNQMLERYLSAESMKKPILDALAQDAVIEGEDFIIDGVHNG